MMFHDPMKALDQARALGNHGVGWVAAKLGWVIFDAGGSIPNGVEPEVLCYGEQLMPMSDSGVKLCARAAKRELMIN